jgi:hypothetical protein
MQIANNSVFNNNVSSYGNWVDIARYTTWSLHVLGLETDGTLTLWFSNEVRKPTGLVADTSAVASATTITGTGDPLLVDGDTFPSAHWMQIQKTQGTTPTATVVWQFAQMSAN